MTGKQGWGVDAMGLRGSVVVLALVFGAVPALAQESPGIIPIPAQPKAAQVRLKTVAAKPKAPEIAAPVTVVVKSVSLEAGSAKLEPAPDTAAGFSDNERLKIQSALLWSGDYTGSVGGEDLFLFAIKNFQKRARSKITGVLTPIERANLLAAAKAHEDDYGWSVMVDPVTGVRVGLPSKLVPQVYDTARGTRWSSAHGEVQVETFRIKDPDLKLATFFEQQKKEPSNRKIENSVLRDDNFFISGMQGLKRFSVRAHVRNGEVRGLTILFDQMMETIVAPVTPAMVSAFSPFPEGNVPYASMAGPVEYGTGLVVSARGHIVTDHRLASGCRVIVAAGLGDADRIAEDKDTGLSLLRVYGPRDLSPLALTPGQIKRGDVTLVGIPDPKEQDGAKRLTEVKARLAEGNAIELRQPVPMAGFSGAATLDAQGQFLGMIEMRNFVLASIEPSAPPVRLVTAAAIRDFLDSHGVAPAAQGGDAKASIVRVICVRR